MRNAQDHMCKACTGPGTGQTLGIFAVNIIICLFLLVLSSPLLVNGRTPSYGWVSSSVQLDRVSPLNLPESGELFQLDSFCLTFPKF